MSRKYRRLISTYSSDYRHSHNNRRRSWWSGELAGIVAESLCPSWFRRLQCVWSKWLFILWIICWHSGWRTSWRQLIDRIVLLQFITLYMYLLMYVHKYTKMSRFVWIVLWLFCDFWHDFKKYFVCCSVNFAIFCLKFCHLYLGSIWRIAKDLRRLFGNAGFRCCSAAS